MITATMYETATGKVRWTWHSSDAGLSDVVEAGLSAIEGAYDGSTHYVVDGEATLRPANPTTIDKLTITADGVDAFTLSGYPTGAEVAISGPTNYVGVLSSGNDSFTTTIAGTYRVRVTAFPNLDTEFTVHAS